MGLLEITTDTPIKLSQRVRSALHAFGDAALQQVGCEVEGNCVTLRGQLPGYYLKQVAQTIAMKVPGVRQVRNEIVVEHSTTTISGSGKMKAKTLQPKDRVLYT